MRARELRLRNMTVNGTIESTRRGNREWFAGRVRRKRLRPAFAIRYGTRQWASAKVQAGAGGFLVCVRNGLHSVGFSFF